MKNFDYQSDLGNSSALGECLAAAGLGWDACRKKAELFAAAAGALHVGQASGLPGRQNARPTAFFVPGRIEVLGKHTDYAGGRSMIAAAERGFCLVAAPRDDRLITVVDAATGDRICFTLDPPPEPPPGHWSNYPMTVARRIARNFPGANRGVDIALAGDLPPAAGMSSSSALIVGIFLVLADVNQLSGRPEYRDNIHTETDLASYLGTVENGQGFGSLEGDRGVGTFGGSEDHTAILRAEAGHVSQYAYCPVRFERSVPISSGYTFAIGSSGVVAEKTGAAQQQYNRASRLASAVAELWREATGRDDLHLAAVLASSPHAADKLREIIKTSSSGAFAPPALSARFEHFLTENEEIVPAAGDALADGDIAAFGRLVDASQHAAEELLGNQVPQTVYLATSARQHGAVAASAFGAGFGGSVWAIVETGRADSFLAAWSEAYRGKFPENSPAGNFFLTGAGPAAFRIW